MKETKEACDIMANSKDMAAHWDLNYTQHSNQNWTEWSNPAIERWLSDLQLSKNALFFLAGVGDAHVVEYLIGLGYENIIANDISSQALSNLSRRVNSPAVRYLNDDLIQPKYIHDFHGHIDVYIDRATLHFFTTCAEKDFYFNQLHELLKPGGYSMIGVFNKNNVPRCCGLDLQLWSAESLKNRLSNYEHKGEFSQAFRERNGRIRNYIYLMSQKRAVELN